MSKGFDNFDIVYYINLEHRTDRKDNILKELEKTNIEPKKINRIEGIYTSHFGQLGCSKSHVLALETFLKTSDDIKTCVIFEDDFIFTESQEKVNELINNVFTYCSDFDVLFLSSNTQKEIEGKFPFVTKIIEARSLSGYCVNKKFAAILLENMKYSSNMMETINYIGYMGEFCVDMYISKLQPDSNWLCLKPKIGKQFESYSDIEGRVVSYDV